MELVGGCMKFCFNHNEPLFIFYISSLNSCKQNGDDDILYKNTEHLKEFQADPITCNIVQNWYKVRIYEIEENTGLVEHALSFAILARERGIKV